jgi:hypothetical protein
VEAKASQPQREGDRPTEVIDACIAEYNALRREIEWLVKSAAQYQNFALLTIAGGVTLGGLVNQQAPRLLIVILGTLPLFLWIFARLQFRCFEEVGVAASYIAECLAETVRSTAGRPELWTWESFKADRNRNLRHFSVERQTFLFRKLLFLLPAFISTAAAAGVLTVHSNVAPAPGYSTLVLRPAPRALRSGCALWRVPDRLRLGDAPHGGCAARYGTLRRGRRSPVRRSVPMDGRVVRWGFHQAGHWPSCACLPVVTACLAHLKDSAKTSAFLRRLGRRANMLSSWVAQVRPCSPVAVRRHRRPGRSDRDEQGAEAGGQLPVTTHRPPLIRPYAVSTSVAGSNSRIAQQSSMSPGANRKPSSETSNRVSPQPALARRVPEVPRRVTHHRSLLGPARRAPRSASPPRRGPAACGPRVIGS